jgi:hypothetical protein
MAALPAADWALTMASRPAEKLRPAGQSSPAGCIGGVQGISNAGEGGGEMGDSESGGIEMVDQARELMQLDTARLAGSEHYDWLQEAGGLGKLRRVLLAWCRRGAAVATAAKERKNENVSGAVEASEPKDGKGWAYKQGLDVLAAPLVVISSGDEDLAAELLHGFIGRFLPGHFAPNSSAMRGWLRLVGRFLTLWDPELALHLNQLAVVPELYAVPWLATAFADVLPLGQLLALWDLALCFDDTGNTGSERDPDRRYAHRLDAPRFFALAGVALLQLWRHKLMAMDLSGVLMHMSAFNQVLKCITSIVYNKRV